jgi:hypothetical protein
MTPFRKFLNSAVSLAVLVGVLYFQFIYSPHGEKLTFKKGELYYTKNVTRVEAQKLLDYLGKEGFFSDTDERSVQLDKVDGIHAFRMVVRAGLQNDPKTMKTLTAFGRELSRDVFGGAPVNVHACNDKLVTQRVMPFVSLGKPLEFAGGQLFYLHPVTAAEATRLGQYLVEHGFFDNTPKTVQLAKSRDVYQFRMVVIPGMENDEALTVTLAAFGETLSQGVFEGQAVAIQLCDTNMDIVRTLPATAPAAS